MRPSTLRAILSPCQQPFQVAHSTTSEKFCLLFAPLPSGTNLGHSIFDQFCVNQRPITLPFNLFLVNFVSRENAQLRIKMRSCQHYHCDSVNGRVKRQKHFRNNAVETPVVLVKQMLKRCVPSFYEKHCIFVQVIKSMNLIC